MNRVKEPFDPSFALLRPTIERLIFLEDTEEICIASKDLTKLNFEDSDNTESNAVSQGGIFLPSLHLIADKYFPLNNSNSALNELLFQCQRDKKLGNFLSTSERCCPASHLLTGLIRCEFQS